MKYFVVQVKNILMLDKACLVIVEVCKYQQGMIVTGSYNNQTIYVTGGNLIITRLLME